MPQVTIIYGEKVRSVDVATGSLVGDAVAATDLPLEQPCAGRGTCGKCKILVESGAAPPDSVEASNLTVSWQSATAWPVGRGCRRRCR